MSLNDDYQQHAAEMQAKNARENGTGYPAWQSMKTAPKARLLLHCPFDGENIVTGYWCDLVGCWLDDADREIAPDSWQHLPEPPVNERTVR